MREITGDLFDFHTGDNWIAITTNGFVKANGEAVLGRGTARQAAIKYPFLPKALGVRLRETGNHVYRLPKNIFSFPVKDVWWEKARPPLISRSVRELIEMVDDLKAPAVYMPRPGCGNGGLDWAQVKPLLASLDDRFTIVELP